MDLILWRHAEAEDALPGQDDWSRRLSTRGEKQALRMAAWLDRNLPTDTLVLCSPAVRTRQTVQELSRPCQFEALLSPENSADDLLQAVQWPQARGCVLVVGHQPTLGQVIARLLGMKSDECAVKKGSVWWLRQRHRNGAAQTVLVTVQTAELLAER